MILRSPIALIAAIILILSGCVQLYLSKRYADAARQEATRVGNITDVVGGRTTTYNYVFKIGEVELHDDSSSCHTALSSKSCTAGAPVTVYYAHLPVLETRLQEFGEASREKLFTSKWMISAGFLLTAIFLVLRRKADGPQDALSGDDSEN